MQPAFALCAFLNPIRFLGVALGLLSVTTHLGAATPTPTVAESTFQSLNGAWQIALDPNDVGRKEGWFAAASFPSATARTIQVPGNIYEAWPGYNGVVWYSLSFEAAQPAAANSRSFLQFGAVQYSCEVWLNGAYLGAHEGASSPFEFDVTKLLLSGQPNYVALRVFSPKSFFSNGGTYPVAYDMGGINQYVTLATYVGLRVIDVFAKPDQQNKSIQLEITLENYTDSSLKVALTGKCNERKSGYAAGGAAGDFEVAPGRWAHPLMVSVPGARLWNLEDPFLYTVTVDAAAAGIRDRYVIPRVGFREFHVDENGFFRLNGKRIFLRSTHHNIYDPLAIQGTPRDMKYLALDAARLKQAGFNMERFICYPALPEQLDLADEQGLLIYDEHQASWKCNDTTKFGVDLSGTIRRDRNHPSVVIWGLLNEEENHKTYLAAREFLPRLRALDPTRLTMLSSGRFDEDFTTGSASNPYTSTWGVYLGGEDPVAPVKTGRLTGAGPRNLGGYSDGGGDLHVYQPFPTTWEFVTDFSHLAESTKPVFISEGGCGSAYDVIAERRKLIEAGATAENHALVNWVNPMYEGLQKAWTRYGLADVYPAMEDMFIESAVRSARERDLFFSIVRSNPRTTGYSLTSMLDSWGTGEGVMDTFREFKPDNLSVLQQGWAKLRWCLFVNPTNVYAGHACEVKVALANEGVLSPGEHSARLAISGPTGEVWHKTVHFHIASGDSAPLAYAIFDQSVETKSWAEGSYTLNAQLDGSPNASAEQLVFFVTDPRALPTLAGYSIYALALETSVQKLFERQGATIKEFGDRLEAGHDVIVVGGKAPLSTKQWRSLYGMIARGAQVVFLSGEVFRGASGPNHWLALPQKGTQSKAAVECELYHPDFVLKKDAITAGLPTGISNPAYYGSVLISPSRFHGMTAPDRTIGAAFYCTAGIWDDWLTVGTYWHHRGKFTVNSLNLLGAVGNPAADRILINLVAVAGKDTLNLSDLPKGYDAELSGLGIDALEEGVR